MITQATASYVAPSSEEAAYLGTGPVPAGPYYRDDWFALEREAIFRRTWLQIGHVCELPEPGSYIVRQLDFAQDSILITRANDGVMRALHNVCTHRGTRHGSGANPSFTNPAAGNYHPGAGPAIDSADASAIGFEGLDLDGLPPLDQPGVVDTGAGVPTYADRGALEAVDSAPLARLTVTPRKTRIGQFVTADASASADDIGIVSYRFDWNDGTVTTQAGPIATHAWATKGNKKVRLTVTDTAGQTATVQVVVQVSAR